MSNRKRRICIPLSTRGNYGKLKSTLQEINNYKDVELQIIIAGGLVLESYGDFKRVIEEDGFKISGEIPFLANGDSTEIMSIASGTAQIQFSKIIARLKPDIVFITADRFESLSFAQSALCMNCFIAHLEGGEISGSIDERIRHAITKLSHVHFVANNESAKRVHKMGEKKENIVISGNPSIDLINKINFNNLTDLYNYLEQKKINLNLNEPYLVISQHPVVTEVEYTQKQIELTFEALKTFDMKKIWILPNPDAGNLKAIKFLKRNIQLMDNPIHIINSLHLELYAKLLKGSKCLIGNSSSGIRECAYLGVPSVNIGNRQFGRLRGANTIDCGHNVNEIINSIKMQLEHGFYPTSNIYGKGDSGKIIANYLSNCDLSIEKTITY